MTFEEKQVWSPKSYAEHGRFVADMAGGVLDLLEAKSGEALLDLGCGDGVLSIKLQEIGAIVTAVDASPEMIDAAIELGLNARVRDGQNLNFDGEFDAVFSNAALHWMPNVDGVIASVFKALKPGGRFVAECGGFGNIAAMRTAIRAAHKLVTGRSMPDDRKVFPSVNYYRDRLSAGGFDVDQIAIISRQTPQKSGVRAWYETFGGRFFDGVTLEQKTAIIDEAEALLKPELCDEYGNWFADYQRLRFKAQKPV